MKQLSGHLQGKGAGEQNIGVLHGRDQKRLTVIKGDTKVRDPSIRASVQALIGVNV